MAKFLVLGDIHNEYKFFMDASIYAEQNDLHIISVGDVVDYGPHATSTIALASTLSKTGKATFIEGNHDNKIYRYLKGNNVTVSHGMTSTIDALESDPIVKEDFMTFYERMKTHMVIGNTHMTHGAFTKSYWTDEVNEKAQNRARLYGEIDKSKPFVEWNGQQYPARTYAWVDAIPSGKTVIVGHDRSPFHEIPAFESNINEVVESTNDLGGTVIFTDTGAGKGGFVSGVVLDENGNKEEIIYFD